MHIYIPASSLILFIGTSSSGKSTFARKHFRETEIISSDRCRALICDDENNMDATSDAVELMHFLGRKRLHRKLLTVVDATNLRQETRAEWLAIAEHFDVPVVAMVFNLPAEVLWERYHARTDRIFGEEVLERMIHDLRKAIPQLQTEGYQTIYQVHSPEEMKAVEVILQT